MFLATFRISEPAASRRYQRIGIGPDASNAQRNTWYRAFGEEGLGRHPRAPTDADSTTRAAGQAVENLNASLVRKRIRIRCWSGCGSNSQIARPAR